MQPVGEVVQVLKKRWLRLLTIKLFYLKWVHRNKGAAMKRRDLVVWLNKHGATYKEGGKHTKVRCNGRQTTLPRHTEIDNRLADAICDQLGIDRPPSK